MGIGASCIIVMDEQITLLSEGKQLVKSGLARASGSQTDGGARWSAGQVFPPRLIPGNRRLFALIAFDINDAAAGRESRMIVL